MSCAKGPRSVVDISMGRRTLCANAYDLVIEAANNMYGAYSRLVLNCEPKHGFHLLSQHSAVGARVDHLVHFSLLSDKDEPLIETKPSPDKALVFIEEKVWLRATASGLLTLPTATRRRPVPNCQAADAG